MGVDDVEDAIPKIFEFNADLFVLISPNPSIPGPKKAMEILKETKIPTVTVSDNPAKKATKTMEEAGIGYIIVEGDVMIGARKEFLDQQRWHASTPIS